MMANYLGSDPEDKLKPIKTWTKGLRQHDPVDMFSIASIMVDILVRRFGGIPKSFKHIKA